MTYNHATKGSCCSPGSILEMQISCPEILGLGPSCFNKLLPCVEKFKCTGTWCLKQRCAWPFVRCVESNLLLMIVNTPTFMNNLYVHQLQRFFKIQISVSIQFWLSQNLHPEVGSRMYIILKFLRGFL